MHKITHTYDRLPWPNTDGAGSQKCTQGISKALVMVFKKEQIWTILASSLTYKEMENHHSYPHNKKKAEQIKVNNSSYIYQKIEVTGKTATTKIGKIGE